MSWGLCQQYVFPSGLLWQINAPKADLWEGRCHQSGRGGDTSYWVHGHVQANHPPLSRDVLSRRKILLKNASDRVVPVCSRAARRSSRQELQLHNHYSGSSHGR